VTQKLSCEEVLSKLYAYLDQEVDALTEADVDAHLHSCRECFSRAEFEKMLRKKVAATAELETPGDVRERLESLIKRF
jgi:anti-sigma factor (TIGR02949 family)